MRREHRSVHWKLWLVLAPAILGLAVAALAMRADPPAAAAPPAQPTGVAP